MAISKQYGLAGVSGDVELGRGGVRIRSESGVLVARQNNGSTSARVAGADPQTDMDFVTKGYLERKADIIVSGSLNGGSPPAVVNGQVLFCTATGGGFTSGELYRGESGVWTLLPKFAGMKISVTIAGIGSFQADSLYLWDVEGTSWILIGATPATTAVKRYLSFDITMATPTGVNAISNLPSGAIVTSVLVQVTTVFNGTSPTIAVGFATDTPTANAGAMATDEVDMKTLGLYQADARLVNPSSQNLNINYTKSTSTTGQLNVLVEYFMP